MICRVSGSYRYIAVGPLVGLESTHYTDKNCHHTATYTDTDTDSQSGIQHCASVKRWLQPWFARRSIRIPLNHAIPLDDDAMVSALYCHVQVLVGADFAGVIAPQSKFCGGDAPTVTREVAPVNHGGKAPVIHGRHASDDEKCLSFIKHRMNINRQ